MASVPKADLLNPLASPYNPRKRRASHSPKLNTLPPGIMLPSQPQTGISIPALPMGDWINKRRRTNTPWTPQEEQRLKRMRDAGLSWTEIVKVGFEECIQDVLMLTAGRHFLLEQKGV